jgi:hypothetical protein
MRSTFQDIRREAQAIDDLGFSEQRVKIAPYALSGALSMAKRGFFVSAAICSAT